MNFGAEKSAVAVVSPVEGAMDVADRDHVTSSSDVSPSKQPANDVTPPGGSGKCTATVHPITVDTSQFVFLPPVQFFALVSSASRTNRGSTFAFYSRLDCSYENVMYVWSSRPVFVNCRLLNYLIFLEQDDSH